MMSRGAKVTLLHDSGAARGVGQHAMTEPPEPGPLDSEPDKEGQDVPTCKDTMC